MPPDKRRYHGEPEIFVPVKKAKKSITNLEDYSISLPSVEAEMFDRKAGTIERIQLENFMVHQKLDYSPGPRVNLLTGRNGSGKSSVLQAIVIGLGGKASDTKRGSNLKQFVRTGCSKAEIRIHVFNGGNDAYKPDRYGEKIIFERIISASAGASFTIKNEAGNDLFSGRAATDEKSRIFEHFGIEVSNPLIILQQEEAKSFFQKTDPKSLYTFFENGSMLMNVRRTSKSTIQQILNFEEALKKDEEKLSAKRAQLKRLEDHYGSVEEKRSDLQGRMAWGRINKELKPRLDKKRKEAEDLKKTIGCFVDEISNKKEELSVNNREKQKIQQDLAIVIDEISRHNKEIEASIEAESTLNQQVEELDKNVQQLSNDKNNVSRTIKYCENEIRNSALNKANNNQTSNLENIVRELEQLVKEEDELKKEISQFGDKRDLINAEMKTFDSKQDKIKAAIAHLNDLREGLHHDLNAARNANDDLSVYGRDMVNLVRDIDRNANRFTVKPIGPIGRHIALNKEFCTHKEAANLIQVVLGDRFLKSFITANVKDRELFYELARKHFDGSGPPDVYNLDKKLVKGRYDVRRNQVVSTPDAPVLLDFLKIDNDDVFNIVIDNRNCETVIVTTCKKAQELFSSRETVPKNARRAISYNYFTYFPPTLGNYSSYYIEKPRFAKNLLLTGQDATGQITERMRELEEEIRVKESELKAVQNERVAKSEERCEILKQIDNLNKKVTDIRKRLTQLHSEQSQLKDKGKSISENKVIIAKEKSRLAELSSDYDAKVALRRQKKEDIDALRKQVDQKFKKPKTNLEEKKVALERKEIEISRVIQNLENHISNEMGKMSQRQKSLIELEKDCNALESDYQSEQKRALKLTNGKELQDSEVIPSAKESKALEKQYLKDRAEIFKELHVSEDQVDEVIKALKVEVANLEANVNVDKVRFQTLDQNQQTRFDATKCVIEITEREFKRTLSYVTKSSGITCKPSFNHFSKKLELQVAPPRSGSKYVELTSLSGGEKSKVLVCLIHALWDHLQCPFRGLDEWDVFLDEKSRKGVEQMMVETAKRTKFQYFFISPQNTHYSRAEEIRSNRNLVNVYSF